MRTPEQVNAAKVVTEAQKMIANQQLFDRLPSLMNKGVAAGAGIGGVALLLQALKSSTTQPSSSYTTPVEAVVYRPDRPLKKRRRPAKIAALVAGVFKQAETPATPVAGGLAPEITADVLGSNPWTTTAVAASLGIGVPVGLKGAKTLSAYLQRIARDRELRSAQREFELAMQTYAESGDDPLRTKRAGMSHRQQLIARLAENCMELCQTKTASVADVVKQNMLAYATLAPLLAGVYGFNHQWKNRDAKDLQLAERQLNIKREQSTPTFTVATLKNPPDLDNNQADQEELHREQQDAISDAVDRFDLDYL